MLKYQTQKGFTIVELLIVIVVIGILAALVLNTFAGVQKRARDTQRQTDVSALSTQLEAYYSDKGAYPQLSQFNDTTKATALFKGVDLGSFDAPSSTSTYDVQGTATTDIGKYGYVALNSGGTACAADDACTQFTLTYKKEDDAAVVSKSSLNVNPAS